jgi:hypothetical protein
MASQNRKRTKWLPGRGIVPILGEQFENPLASANPDLLREMIKSFAQQTMDAEVESILGWIPPGQHRRLNYRNGCRRESDA